MQNTALLLYGAPVNKESPYKEIRFRMKKGKDILNEGNLVIMGVTSKNQEELIGHPYKDMVKALIDFKALTITRNKPSERTYLS
jgi:hypothetical protein